MTTRRLPIQRLALRVAVLAALASNVALSQAQEVLAPPANRSGGVSYTPGTVPATGMWDPQTAAAQMQSAFDYETNLTQVAITTVNNALTNTSNLQASANNAYNAALNSYNNSYNVYNAVNGVNDTSSTYVTSAVNAYTNSANTQTTTNTNYQTVASAPASTGTSTSVPVVITSFTGPCGDAYAIMTDGTKRSMGQVC